MNTLEPAKNSNDHEVEIPPDYLVVSNSDLYQEIRGVVVEKKLWSMKDKWPTTDIETSRHKAVAQIRPNPQIEKMSDREFLDWQERVAKYVLKLNDLTADVLDVVCTLWLETSPKSSDSMILLRASDFLKFRGIKTRQEVGGFDVKRKREVEEQIALLSNLWIEVVNESKDQKREKFFRSTAIAVTSEVGEKDGNGSETIYAWRVRPGDIFMPFLLGPGRILAPLAKIALHFDPYRQKLQKRLTRYLTWIWRIRQGYGTFLQPFLVEVLLDNTKTIVDKNNPLRTKDKLEEALDDLKKHKVISDWQYSPGTDHASIGTRGWVSSWLKWKIEIEPPSAILEFYFHQVSLSSKKIAKVEKVEKNEKILGPLIKELKLYRQKNNLTQLRVAQDLGISSIYLSKIERGEKKLSRKMSQLIRNLLQLN